MRIFSEIPGMLAFRTHALRVQAERKSVAGGIVWFSIGFLTYAIIRNFVYADLLGLADLEGAYVDLDLGQIILNIAIAIIFLQIVYIPALIILGNAISGDGFGFSISRQEYRAHSSGLMPLWGALFLLASPLQWLKPSLISIGFFEFEFSPGVMIFMILVLAYSVWAIKHLAYLTVGQSLGVIALSWFTLPILFLLLRFIFALPFFILVPLLYLAYQRLRENWARRAGEASFRQNLQALTLNPQDADAHYQLGLIHLKRRNIDSARRDFEEAMKIQPADPDYHYHLGRTHESIGEWQLALDQYEETYRLKPDYGLGDIFREVGKAYLHTGSVEKGREFLEHFLKTRGSDPEGRYWLAIALERLGEKEQMRFQLNMLLEQFRSNPRFFRKGNREWIYRARKQLRDSKPE
jgi:cytochrome c-type biogenesis protein CcmH/NrfG